MTLTLQSRLVLLVSCLLAAFGGAITIVITGLAFVIEVVGFEEASWRNLTRPVLTFTMAGSLLAMLVFALQNEWLRDFFAFTRVEPIGWAVAVIASIAALVARYAFSRYWKEILAILTAQPRPDEQPRGRSA